MGIKQQLRDLKLMQYQVKAVKRTVEYKVKGLKYALTDGLGNVTVIHRYE